MSGREWMGVPSLKYQSDPVYRQVVDMLEAMIHRAEMTPGEVREAAMLASIHYEQRNIRAAYSTLRKGALSDAAFLETQEMVLSADTRVQQLKEFLEANRLPDEEPR